MDDKYINVVTVIGEYMSLFDVIYQQNISNILGFEPDSTTPLDD